MSDSGAFMLAAGFAVGMWLLAHGLDSLGDRIAGGLKRLSERK